MKLIDEILGLGPVSKWKSHYADSEEKMRETERRLRAIWDLDESRADAARDAFFRTWSEEDAETWLKWVGRRQKTAALDVAFRVFEQSKGQFIDVGILKAAIVSVRRELEKKQKELEKSDADRSSLFGTVESSAGPLSIIKERLERIDQARALLEAGEVYRAAVQFNGNL